MPSTNRQIWPILTAVRRESQMLYIRIYAVYHIAVDWAILQTRYWCPLSIQPVPYWLYVFVLKRISVVRTNPIDIIAKNDAALNVEQRWAWTGVESSGSRSLLGVRISDDLIWYTNLVPVFYTKARSALSLFFYKGLALSNASKAVHDFSMIEDRNILASKIRIILFVCSARLRVNTVWGRIRARWAKYPL